MLLRSGSFISFGRLAKSFHFMQTDIQAEVIAEYQAQIRRCLGCQSMIQKINGCDWVQCPQCKRGMCFRCGKEIPHSGAALASHSCDSNGFQQKEIARRTARKAVQNARPGVWRIVIETDKGQSIPIECSPDDSIDVLKDKINQRTGFPSAQQTLTCAGKPLLPGTVLKQTPVRDGSSVTLTVPAAGGN
jgi:hypothetical protein